MQEMNITQSALKLKPPALLQTAVSRSIPDNSIAVGNPARVIKSYTDFVKEKKEKMKQVPIYDKSYSLFVDVSQDKKEEMIKALENSTAFVF